MSSALPNGDAAASRSIVVDELFPHAPATVWKALTSGALMGRWMMAPTGFEPVVGCRFTFQTKPAGAWDGVIHCEVLEVRPTSRFVYRWQGGHSANVGYGAPLDTVVTFTLDEVDGGTRLRLVHAGFRLPENETAYTGMGEGWKTVVSKLGTLVDAGGAPAADGVPAAGERA